MACCPRNFSVECLHSDERLAPGRVRPFRGWIDRIAEGCGSHVCTFRKGATVAYVRTAQSARDPYRSYRAGGGTQAFVAKGLQPGERLPLRFQHSRK